MEFSSIGYMIKRQNSLVELHYIKKHIIIAIIVSNRDKQAHKDNLIVLILYGCNVVYHATTFNARNISNQCTFFIFVKAEQHNHIHRLLRGSIIKKSNIGNQCLSFIWLQYFHHHVIPHHTYPTMTRQRQYIWFESIANERC